MKYSNYTSYELREIVTDPRAIANNPHKLLVSFVVNSIYDELIQDEEITFPDEARVPTMVLDKYVEDCIEDFIASAEKGDTIRIRNQGFRIRKFNSFHKDRASDAFNFPVDNENSIITGNGIFDVETKVSSSHEEKSKSYDANRFFFWKVMSLSQTDEGYDKLTDMEVAVYCWAIWIKEQPLDVFIDEDKIKKWWQKYYDYFQIPLDDIISCMNPDMKAANKTNTYFLFDGNLVDAWNKKHSQQSMTGDLQDLKAYNDWYANISKDFCRK